MRPLTAREMLDVWERGRAAPPGDRAILLLAHACPGTSWDALAALPIGRRDERLLTLREWAFGRAFSSVATCPACGERLELSFTVDDVRVSAPALPDGPLTVEVDGYEVEYRLPGTSDLDEARGREDARGHLLRRCIAGVRRNGRKQSVERLPARVADAVVAGMSEADPQADVRTTVSCVGCGHTWEAVFDIVSFFWAELEDWVARTLRDVHALASAYGWTETEILSLSPWRRQCYLRMVGR